MALAKCKSCGAPKVPSLGSLSSHLVRFFVEWVPFLEAFMLIRFVNSRAPLNYPKTSVICGSKGCENPALIWLTQAEEHHYYELGKRVFELEALKVKVRVR
jgi:hypothetical protein